MTSQHHARSNSFSTHRPAPSASSSRHIAPSDALSTRSSSPPPTSIPASRALPMSLGLGRSSSFREAPFRAAGPRWMHHLGMGAGAAAAEGGAGGAGAGHMHQRNASFASASSATLASDHRFRSPVAAGFDSKYSVDAAHDDEQRYGGGYDRENQHRSSRTTRPYSLFGSDDYRRRSAHYSAVERSGDDDMHSPYDRVSGMVSSQNDVAGTGTQQQRRGPVAMPGGGSNNACNRRGMTSPTGMYAPRGDVESEYGGGRSRRACSAREPPTSSLSSPDNNLRTTPSGITYQRSLQRSPLGPAAGSATTVSRLATQNEERLEERLEEFPSIPRSTTHHSGTSATSERRRVRLLVDEDDTAYHEAGMRESAHGHDSSGDLGMDPDVADVLATLRLEDANTASSSPKFSGRVLPALPSITATTQQYDLGLESQRPRDGMRLRVSTLSTAPVAPRGGSPTGHQRRQTWTGRDLSLEMQSVGRGAPPSGHASPTALQLPASTIIRPGPGGSWVQHRPGVRNAMANSPGPASPTRRFSPSSDHGTGDGAFSYNTPTSSSVIGGGAGSSSSGTLTGAVAPGNSGSNAGRSDEYASPALQGEVTHAQKLLERAAADFLRQKWLDGPLRYSPHDYNAPGQPGCADTEFRAPELRDRVHEVSRAAVAVDRGLRALSEGRARLGGVAQLNLERDVERLWRESGDVVRGLTEILLMISEHGVPGPAWKPYLDEGAGGGGQRWASGLAAGEPGSRSVRFHDSVEAQQPPQRALRPGNASISSRANEAFPDSSSRHEGRRGFSR